MRVVSWAVLGLAIIPLAVLEVGWAQARRSGEPVAGISRTPATPHLRVGGRIGRHHKPAGGIIHLDAFVPGSRSAATVFLLRTDKSSLLLRADADGRLTPIEPDDLYKGNELDNVRAVIAREADSKDYSHLVHWLVVYPKGVNAPPLWDKEPDTTY